MWILILILISTDCFAGVDFSMMGQSQYELPVFVIKEQAEEWAYHTKWVEPIRRRLKHRMEEIRLEVSNLDMGRIENTRYASTVMYQRELYGIALEVMERYKRAGIKGDSAQVGSSFYAGSSPCHLIR